MREATRGSRSLSVSELVGLGTRRSRIPSVSKLVGLIDVACDRARAAENLATERARKPDEALASRACPASGAIFAKGSSNRGLLQSRASRVEGSTSRRLHESKAPRVEGSTRSAARVNALRVEPLPCQGARGAYANNFFLQADRRAPLRPPFIHIEFANACGPGVDRRKPHETRQFRARATESIRAAVAHRRCPATVRAARRDARLRDADHDPAMEP